MIAFWVLTLSGREFTLRQVKSSGVSHNKITQVLCRRERVETEQVPIDRLDFVY